MSPRRRELLQRLGLGLIAFCAFLFFKPLEDAYLLPQRLGLGLGALLLCLAAPPRWPAGPVAWGALGWLAWRCFCRAAADPPGSAPIWALEQLPLAVLLVFGGAALLQARLRRNLAAALLGALALASAYALLPRLGFDPFSDGGVDLGFGARVFGSLGNPDFLGGWLALLLPLALAAAWRLRGASRWLAALALALGSAALALTGARASWLAALVGMGILAWRLGGLRLDRRRLAGLGLALLLAVGGAWTLRSALPPRLAEAVDLKGESWQSRFFMGGVAWELALRHPIIGVGPGGFGPAFLERQGERLSAGEAQPWRLTFDAHDDWLQTAAESGFVGLFLWVLVFALALRAAWRRGGLEGAALAGGLAAFGVQGLFHFPWAIVPSAGLLVLGLGLAAAFESPDGAPLPRWAAAVAVALSLLAVGLFWRQSLASACLNSGVAVGLNVESRPLSLGLFAKAAALRPDDQRAWSRLAGEQLHAGRPAEAIDSLQKSLALLPGLPESWTNLCLALGQQGSLEAADEACAQAVALKPSSAEAWSNWGKVAWMRGQNALAEQRLRAGLQKAGPAVQTAFNLGALLYNAGRYPEAAQSFREVLRLDPGHAEARRLLKESTRAR